MSDVVKVEVYIQTDKVGSKCSDVLEFDKENWEGMTEEEQEECLYFYVWNIAEWGWEVLEG